MSKDISEELFEVPREAVRNRLAMHMRPAQRRTVVQFSDADKNNDQKRSLPPIKKASALLSAPLPLPSELIEGLLHVGSSMVISGGPKTNKTFLLMDLAVSVATGTPWWGLKTQKGKVLYLDFEVGENFFGHRLEKITNAKGVTVESVEGMDYWPLKGHATDLSHLIDLIIEHAQGGGYSLIVIDPIFKVLGKRDENSAGDITSLMNEVEKLSVATGASIILAHHFSKGNQAGKSSMDRGSGSGVFSRHPEAIVSVTPHQQEGVYVIEADLRHLRRMDKFCVEWDYPLMVRRVDLEPADLKKNGKGNKTFYHTDLLMTLGNQERSAGEWKEETLKLLKMGGTTFENLRRSLLTSGRISKTANGKWKANQVLGYEETKHVKRLRDNQVQGATSANAPSAQ